MVLDSKVQEFFDSPEMGIIRAKDVPLPKKPLGFGGCWRYMAEWSGMDGRWIKGETGTPAETNMILKTTGLYRKTLFQGAI